MKIFLTITLLLSVANIIASSSSSSSSSGQPKAIIMNASPAQLNISSAQLEEELNEGLKKENQLPSDYVSWFNERYAGERYAGHQATQRPLHALVEKSKEDQKTFGVDKYGYSLSYYILNSHAQDIHYFINTKAVHMHRLIDLQDRFTTQYKLPLMRKKLTSEAFCYSFRKENGDKEYTDVTDAILDQIEDGCANVGNCDDEVPLMIVANAWVKSQQHNAQQLTAARAAASSSSAAISPRTSTTQKRIEKLVQKGAFLDPRHPDVIDLIVSYKRLPTEIQAKLALLDIPTAQQPKLDKTKEKDLKKEEK